MSQTHPVLASLDARIAERSILQHPFYQAWTQGKLNRDQLALYAQIYYPHVAAFPAYLRAAMERTSDPVIQAELADNLHEELSVPKSHPELWLDFAESCGLHRESVANAQTLASTRSTVATFARLAETGTAEALAALYAYESQQPEVAHTKAVGLSELYGMTDEKALAYFHVHTEADVRHREGERQALERCLAAGTSPEAILQAADEALTAYWELLDGVCQATGIPVTTC